MFVLRGALYGGAIMIIVSMTPVLRDEKQPLIRRMAIILGGLIGALILMSIAYSV